ncbi:ABC transporter ATP-binding protein [Altererythrobacter arenosus]|uniref:ABC transporter ATP-binding protein n=1 Tax=Altererythrobacter arenosus TaxID=3032592 RepID=A0ABY8FPA5_9SPHN|nr:ABC transporter ATP-binding protein [Altererythrobacter sp. CAU 1644]WFL76697.1 ABC transporter ATP-binding protein [Altererythrobacter sp. CAU 1644]
MTLACENLTLARADAEVLHGISATLSTGQITAICGPNGAGKSSLLMALAGLLAPGSGSVTLGGSALGALHPQKRAQQVGYLPQSGEVAWDLSVGNLVALGRLPFRDRGERQIEAALEATHMTELADRPVSTLSGGERARALLARVFAGDPDWVLADEPFAALDLYHQFEVLASLRVAASLGRGVVLVLHDLAMAMNHADRVLVLKEGRLIADGPPEEALATGVIAEVWGVSARWLGEPGARALVTG